MVADTDYLRARIKEIKDAMDESSRLCSKKFEELTTDEKFSIRY